MIYDVSLTIRTSKVLRLDEIEKLKVEIDRRLDFSLADEDFAEIEINSTGSQDIEVVEI